MYLDKITEAEKLRRLCDIDILQKETKNTITLKEIVKQRKKIYQRWGLVNISIAGSVFLCVVLLEIIYKVSLTPATMIAWGILVAFLHQKLQKECAIIKMENDDEYREAIKKQIEKYIATTHHQNISYPANFEKPDIGHPCREMYDIMEETRYYLQYDRTILLLERMHWTHLVNGDEDEKNRLFESAVNLYSTIKELTSSWWRIAQLLTDDIIIYNETKITKDIPAHQQQAVNLSRDAGIKLKLEKIDTKK